MIINLDQELTATVRELIRNVDHLGGWLRPDGDEHTAAIADMVRIGLAYSYRGRGWRLTGAGQAARVELDKEAGDLPPDHGIEPVRPEQFHSCAFHAERQEHRLTDTGDCYSASCGGDYPASCRSCGRRFCRTLSEEHATDARLPVIALDQHHLSAVMQGDSYIVTALDGTEVLLRLMRPGELLAMQHAVVEQADGPAGHFMSFTQAVTMTRPLSLAGLR